jgi:hypothetical protein
MQPRRLSPGNFHETPELIDCTARFGRFAAGQHVAAKKVNLAQNVRRNFVQSSELHGVERFDRNAHALAYCVPGLLCVGSRRHLKNLVFVELEKRERADRLTPTDPPAPAAGTYRGFHSGIGDQNPGAID